MKREPFKYLIKTDVPILDKIFIGKIKTLLYQGFCVSSLSCLKFLLLPFFTTSFRQNYLGKRVLLISFL